jgi:ParB family chromosome partitioning protein
MPREGGLGRGLSSLIPQKKSADENEYQYSGFKQKSNLEDQNNSHNKKEETEKDENIKKTTSQKNSDKRGVTELEVDKIMPNPYQPRIDFDVDKLQELADSIKKHGVLQPLVATRKQDGNYELVAGERRLQASKKAGIEKVPVIVRELDKKGKMEIALIENIQRENLNVIEEAKAYQKLKNEFGYTQEEVSKQVGKSRSVIANCLRLLNLPIEIRNALIKGEITEGHARSLMSIENPERQRKVFEQILSKNLTVRDVEKIAGEDQIEVSSYKRSSNNIDPEIKKMENEIEESLGTKAKIKKKKNGKGDFLITFYSEEEFQSLFNKLTSD